MAILAVFTLVQGAAIIVMAITLARAITDLFHEHAFQSVTMQIGLFAGPISCVIFERMEKTNRLPLCCETSENDAGRVA